MEVERRLQAATAADRIDGPMPLRRRSRRHPGLPLHARLAHSPSPLSAAGPGPASQAAYPAPQAAPGPHSSLFEARPLTGAPRRAFQAAGPGPRVQCGQAASGLAAWDRALKAKVPRRAPSHPLPPAPACRRSTQGPDAAGQPASAAQQAAAARRRQRCIRPRLSRPTD